MGSKRRKAHGMRVFESRLVRNEFVPYEEKVAGGYRKLESVELHSSRSVVTAIKSKRMRWRGMCLIFFTLYSNFTN
jgi:hypothetical protein